MKKTYKQGFKEEKMKYDCLIRLELDNKLAQDDTEIIISNLHSLGYKTGELKISNLEIVRTELGKPTKIKTLLLKKMVKSQKQQLEEGRLISVYEGDYEMLTAINRVFLKDKGFDLDPTYSKGVFYKKFGFQEPREKSDLVSLYPKVKGILEVFL